MAIINNIWPVAVGLLLLIAANVVIGSCDAWIAGQFDIKVFFKGIIKGLIIAACCLMAYAAGYLNPDVTFSFNGASVALTSAMTLFMITAYGAYALKVLRKLYELFKLDTSSAAAETDAITADTGNEQVSEPEKAAAAAEQ